MNQNNPTDDRKNTTQEKNAGKEKKAENKKNIKDKKRGDKEKRAQLKKQLEARKEKMKKEARQRNLLEEQIIVEEIEAEDAVEQSIESDREGMEEETVCAGHAEEKSAVSEEMTVIREIAVFQETITDKEMTVSEEMTADKEMITAEESIASGETIAAQKTASKKKAPKKSRAPKERAKKKKIIIVSAAAAAAVVLVSSIAAARLRSQTLRINAENAAVEAMVHMEAVELAEYSQTQHKRDRMKEVLKKDAGKDAVRALVDAARFMFDGVRNRPPEIELTEENAADFATIESCVINRETGKIDITMSAEGLAVSDDGYYYLFEEKTYDTEITDDEYIIEDQKDVDLTFSVNLNYNTPSSRLFSKFVIAVKKDGEFLAISRPKYITNPEAIARSTQSFIQTSSKKGLLVDPEKLAGSELDDLGVKHAAYNIPLSRILGNTTHEHYPTVYYTYNGKTYAFNGQIISEYDYIFSTLSAKGITTTAIILNDLAPGYTQLIHPLARSGGHAPYFAFNAADASGTEYLEAIASFLASRYSGSGHGTVMNWVIGNEINARSEWNYIEYMDTASYVEEYAKAFRIFYNGIRSINGNARVYISIDQQWAKSLYSNNGYSSKEIVDTFNTNIKNGGNIDWGVAQHPYNYPLTSARAWSSSGKAASHVIDSETTPVISIKNIHVLTDYLQKESLRTDSGEVRHVILSEMGYTSSEGQDLQAASFVYAYKVIEANQYIDSMLFSRQTDATLEVNQGLALGINTLGGVRKSIYNAFKYVDTAQSAAHTDFALGIIGISNWNEVIRKH